MRERDLTPEQRAKKCLSDLAGENGLLDNLLAAPEFIADGCMLTELVDYVTDKNSDFNQTDLNELDAWLGVVSERMADAVKYIEAARIVLQAGIIKPHTGDSEVE